MASFESPVIETGLEAHAVYQEFPSGSIFGGGGFSLYALQARFALNERWSLIATKDGYIDLDPDVGSDESGWADIAGGAKKLGKGKQKKADLYRAALANNQGPSEGDR